MATSIRKELQMILLAIAALVALTVLIQYLFQYLDLYFPSLTQYDIYIHYSTYAVIIFGFAVVISHITKNALDILSEKIGGRNLNGLYTILRAIIYGSAITVILLIMGISLTGAILGGTVGGLILSFALQNTISSVLSGLMLSSSGVLKPKEAVYIFSWMFDNPVLGVVKDIRILTTQIKSIDGLIIDLPSTALLSSSQFTDLTYSGDRKLLSHHILMGFAVDVPVWEMMEIGTKNLEAAKETVGIVKFQANFQIKGFNTNSIKVVFVFKDMSRYNDCVNLINTIYEKAYWEVKNRMLQQQSR